jgi:hypothetical protein
MSDKPDDESLPYVKGSGTSRAAAGSMRETARTQRAEVRAFLLGLWPKGATDQEIQDGLGMGGSSERPRRIELEKDGLVLRTNETRKTGSGRAAAVYVAVLPEPEQLKLAV